MIILRLADTGVVLSAAFDAVPDDAAFWLELEITLPSNDVKADLLIFKPPALFGVAGIAIDHLRNIVGKYGLGNRNEQENILLEFYTEHKI